MRIDTKQVKGKSARLSIANLAKDARVQSVKNRKNQTELTLGHGLRVVVGK